jgi:hypothetical protein
MAKTLNGFRFTAIGWRDLLNGFGFIAIRWRGLLNGSGNPAISRKQQRGKTLCLCF